MVHGAVNFFCKMHYTILGKGSGFKSLRSAEKEEIIYKEKIEMHSIFLGKLSTFNAVFLIHYI